MSETVTTSKKRYDELIECENQLLHLEANGVDNWAWYSYYKDAEGYSEEE